jgi:Fe-S cluster assembly protein SufD
MAHDIIVAYADGTVLPLLPDGKGLRLSIDPYVVFDGPVFLTYLRKKEALPLHLTLRSHASVHLIEETSEAHSLLSVEIGEGASFQYSRLYLGQAQSREASFHAVVQEGGSLVCRTASALPFFKSSCFISLCGEGASASFYGLSLLPQSQTSHQVLFVDHRAPNTSSSQLVKGLVAEGAFGSVESHVRISKEAKASSSRQYSHFLTFGATAKTVHKPNFEILTDDVMATHGATTGMIDDEALFYLKTRGLSTEEARRHIINGFCEEIVRELPCEIAPQLRRRIDETIQCGGQ